MNISTIKLRKNLGKLKLLGLPIAAVLVFAFWPGQASAQGALCGNVEASSPYYHMYCQGYPSGRYYNSTPYKHKNYQQSYYSQPSYYQPNYYQSSYGYNYSSNYYSNYNYTPSYYYPSNYGYQSYNYGYSSYQSYPASYSSYYSCCCYAAYGYYSYGC